jgi:hypothetical protein
MQHMSIIKDFVFLKLIQIRIWKLKRSTSVFKALHRKLNDVVPADRPSNNIVLICKKHYIDCWKIKVGLDSLQGNPTYTANTLSKEEIIDNHMSVLSSNVTTWSYSLPVKLLNFPCNRNCRVVTIVSDYRAVGPSNCRTKQLSDHQHKKCGTCLKIGVIHSTSSIPKIKSSRNIFLRTFSFVWRLNCTT